jgi:hypothetical protein
VATSSIISSADEEDVDLAQVLEQLGRQPHRRGRHADGMRADLGGGADFLGHRERALEQLVQRAAQRAGLVGLAHGFLHLAEDLGLAQHHGIEARRHAEGVARGLAVLADVGVGRELAAADPALLGQPVERGPRDLGGLARVGRHVELGAVAGGHQGRLGHGALQPLAETAQRQGQLLGREREPAAQIQRRGRVVQSEGDDAHEMIVRFTGHRRIPDS